MEVNTTKPFSFRTDQALPSSMYSISQTARKTFQAALPLHTIEVQSNVWLDVASAGQN